MKNKHSPLIKTEPLGLRAWLYIIGDELFARAYQGDGVTITHHEVVLSHEAAVTIAEVAHEYARELEQQRSHDPSTGARPSNENDHMNSDTGKNSSQ